MDSEFMSFAKFSALCIVLFIGFAIGANFIWDTWEGRNDCRIAELSVKKDRTEQEDCELIQLQLKQVRQAARARNRYYIQHYGR